MQGLPRPNGKRLAFRIPGEREVRSPALIDYPYALVLDRGLLRVWTTEALTPDGRSTLADLLEREAALLRSEAHAQSQRGISSLLHRIGGESRDGTSDESVRIEDQAEAGDG
jgi:hypothetical protein